MTSGLSPIPKLGLQLRAVCGARNWTVAERLEAPSNVSKPNGRYEFSHVCFIGNRSRVCDCALVLSLILLNVLLQ